MVFLSWIWRRPGAEEQQKLSSSGNGSKDFNYEAECGGCSSDIPLPEERLQWMKRNGYAINHSRVKIGHGRQDAYNKAKKLLQDWRHFQLSWAFVPLATRIEPGEVFCVCSSEILCWIINPLRVRYVHKDYECQSKLIYAFGSGTLQGHLLAGEERFAIEWDKKDNSIWYEIFSFSKPAHPLSAVTYPYVRFKQHLFTKNSSEMMIQEMQKAT